MATITPVVKYCGRGSFETPVEIVSYLLGIIRDRGPVTRTQLVQITGIPRTTLYDNLVQLLLDAKITKRSIPSKTQGRPRTFYEVK